MIRFLQSIALVAFFAGLGILAAHWSVCEQDEMFCTAMEIHK